MRLPPVSRSVALRRRRLAITSLIAVLACVTLAVWPSGVNLGSASAAANATGVTKASTARVPQSAIPKGTIHIVAMGDSSLLNHHCGNCTPFPDLYGTELGKKLHASTSVTNMGWVHLHTKSLYTFLRDPKSTYYRAVKNADVDVILVGANDLLAIRQKVTSGTCGGANGIGCATTRLQAARKNLADILRQIRVIRQGKPTTILLPGYWALFSDGAIGRSRYGSVGLKNAITLTRAYNDVLAAAAKAGRATYVDTFGPFRDNSSHGSITSLLASDGDHLNSKGHQLFAALLLSAGLPKR